MKKNIVFITDCVDVAFNEIRAVVINELITLGTRNSIEIEPVVRVEPFSILNGSFLLRLLADSYSEGTIFSIILNPMKNRPERLFGRTQKKSFIFIGANTGVFDWFLKDFGIAELYELSDPGFLPFGGKYVHAPAVGKLASEIPFQKLGAEFEVSKLKKIETQAGTILHIDNFGLMKFSGELPEYIDGQQLIVKIGDKQINTVYTKRMMSRDTGEWVVYPGSSLGLHELGKVRQNGAVEIGIKIGDIVTIIKK